MVGNRGGYGKSLSLEKQMEKAKKRIAGIGRKVVAAPVFEGGFKGGFKLQAINCYRLRELGRVSRNYADTVNPFLLKLIDAGLLSFTREGNFSLVSKLFPDFSLVPIFHAENKDKESRRMYFVSPGDCEIFGGSFEGGKSGFATDVVCHENGNYVVPDNDDLRGRVWQELVVKFHSFYPNKKELEQLEAEQKSRIADKLVMNRVIGFWSGGEESTGHKVFYKFGNKEKSLYCISLVPCEVGAYRNSENFHFETHDFALAFADSFPRKVRPKLSVRMVKYPSYEVV